MRTVITGGTGRIGSQVASKLRALGHQLVLIDASPPTPNTPAAAAAADFVQCDLRAAADDGEGRQQLLEAMAGADSVVHCAAWPGPSAHPPPAVVASGRAAAKPPIGLESVCPTRLLADNVTTTSAVCDAAVASGVRRFVFSSSAFAFGYSHVPVGPQSYAPHYLPIDEEHEALPLESYGLSKLFGEQILAAAARTASDCSFVSLRFTNIIKREAWSQLPLPPPTPDSPLTLLMWAYVHEDDVVDAHVAATVNAAAAEPGTHETYVLSACNTRFAQPTLPMLTSVLGIAEPPLRGVMLGNASPLSSAKAMERLRVSFRSWQHPSRGLSSGPAARRLRSAAHDRTPRHQLPAAPAQPRPTLPTTPTSPMTMPGTPAPTPTPTLTPTHATTILGVPSVHLRCGLGGDAATAAVALRFRSATLCSASASTPVSASASLSETASASAFEAASARGSGAARAALSDPELRHYDLSGFRLDCGAVLPQGASLAYRVYGPPVGAGAGVILHPTSFDAVHSELEYQIGAGLALDTGKYTVVVPNMLGNGVSFSPSLAVDWEAWDPRGFPLISVADNVRAQRQLLADALGLRSPLAAVYGYSMGAMQAYEWAVAEPLSTAAIVAVCGASRCGDVNAVFLRSLEAALTADGGWDPARGRFSCRPERGLRAFADIYAGWGVGAEWYLERRFAGAGYVDADDFVTRSYEPGFSGCDADDLLSQLRTWRAADVAAHASCDWRAAMARIRARVLLMPCDTDRYFTVTEARREAEALGDKVAFKPIRSAAGHRAGDPHRAELRAERAWIQQHVHDFLAEAVGG